MNAGEDVILGVPLDGALLILLDYQMVHRTPNRCSLLPLSYAAVELGTQ